MTGLISGLSALILGIVLASFMAPAKPIKWKKYRICLYIVIGSIAFYILVMFIVTLVDAQKNDFKLPIVAVIMLLMFAGMYILMFFFFFYKELLPMVNEQIMLSMTLTYWYVILESWRYGYLLSLNRFASIASAVLIIIFLTGFLFILVLKSLKNRKNKDPIWLTGAYIVIFLVVHMIFSMAGILACFVPAFFNSKIPLIVLGVFPSLAVLVAGFSKYQSSRNMKFIHYLWFIIVIIVISAFNISSFNLMQLMEEDALSFYVIINMLLAGMVIFYLSINIFRLFMLFPTPNTKKRYKERLRLWKDRIDEMTGHYSDKQLPFRHAIFYLVMQGGSYFLNYIYKFLSMPVLINFWFIALPFLIILIRKNNRKTI